MYDPSIQNWYAGRTVRENGKQSTVYLAREVLGLKPGDGMIAHHKSHNTLDNRRENLEAVTDSPSTMSRKTFKNSTSGIKGVSYKKNHNGPRKWVARTQFDGKRLHLGYFYTKEEAGEAYEKAAREHHGSYFYR